ncbi:hypothetical protein MWU58_00050 [Flavobacteriaceae bacterium S0825]|uniref:hypothetical protein n=1 Tax=Gaetbulibacter sp. S0825 TaxID=2720084 RepID=UPI00142FED9B|nr:hypothetical protein [Gaetbulibacter sp. S0825]MCK0107671.1 hypothetical protein [Flavobacteriaceae bacterium S0825]NIX63307.1 hypothetical protein [Gaetbulibacter sp. S0825]
MKTIEPKTNRIKSFNKNLLTLLLSVLFTVNISAKINITGDTINDNLSTEMHKLEKRIFTNEEYTNTENLEVNEIEVVEVEEEVQLDFDTTMYLPDNFNALEGKNDLDWSTIELIEIEEEVEIGFDTSKYLPKNFNALKGKNDLDWNTIELIEIEEDIEINFDVKAYLPEGFDPYKGMSKETIEVVVNH